MERATHSCARRRMSVDNEFATITPPKKTRSITALDHLAYYRQTVDSNGADV
jgi:hypothetical protein